MGVYRIHKSLSIMTKDDVNDKLDKLGLDGKVSEDLVNKAKGFIASFDDSKDKPEVKLENELLLLEWNLSTGNSDFRVSLLPDSNEVYFAYDPDSDPDTLDFGHDIIVEIERVKSIDSE